jgi:L-aminopeptidase/D-esterase-like protein
VAYQWRRILTAVGAGIGLTVGARAGGLGLAPSVLVVVAYPIVLFALGFYQPAELQRLKRLRRLAPGW